MTPEGATAPSIIAFIDPVKLYYEGNTAWQKKYAQIIKRPMDYGTIISGICEARYTNVESVLADARLVAENCEKYCSSTTKISLEDARRTDPLTMDAWMLYHRFEEEISSRVISAVPDQETEEENDDNLPSELPKLKISKSKRGSSIGSVTESKEKKGATKKSIKTPGKVENIEVTPSPAPKKPKVNINVKDRYLWCLSELKMHSLKNDAGVDIQTCWLFNLAVDPIQYPNYRLIISNPMDLSMMEKKVKGEKYPQLIAILRDMELIRDNAHTFNPGMGYQ